MTTVAAAPLIGQMFVIGREDQTNSSKIYSSPAGIMISYDYFKQCIDQINEDAGNLYHTAEESTNSLAEGWADTNRVNTSLIKKLRDLTNENKWAFVAVCVLTVAVLVLIGLLILL
jgi:hypothetical protein